MGRPGARADRVRLHPALPLSRARGGAAGGGAPAAEGDLVRVLTMGGAAGRVVAAPGRRGGKLAVRVGRLVVGDLRSEDVAVVRSSGGAAEDRSRVLEGCEEPRQPSGNRRRRRQGKLRQAPADAAGAGAAAAGAGGAPARVQFDGNTCDVRGLRVPDALAAVEGALAAAPPHTCLFVVHGLGTGRVRSEVRELLARSGVARFADEPGSAGGCTVVDV